MPITRTDVEKIAELARLELTDAEADSFTSQLGAILGYIDQLNELDTADVPPMSHCATTADAAEARRDDVVQPSLGQQVATANAPDAEAGYFRVPKVIGG
ncbi:MAG TPA: Asp-tRNA(Asn)/Glu-tRNA(Gln) amidotransferase subunit GatC [Blastocatellia bacterium]|nr:Asp-tRNA(Asn)/Glu-tRNA(Gln) amidotransferase subunit GatC [Blastocatellia bacterium]